jgi:uncharacterized protein
MMTTETCIPVDDPAAVELRASNYNIYVDLQEPGHVLLVHGYSGAFDKVSSSVARYVRSLDSKPPKPLYGSWSGEDDADPIVRPSDATVEVLKKRGYLTGMTREDERARFDAFVRRQHEFDIKRGPGYLFMPTYDCNLRCAYCFQDHMRTDAAYAHLLRMMTPATVDRIVKSTVGIEARHGVSYGEGQKRSVMLFGGEPLLERARPTVAYILEAMNRLGPISVSAVTNGTELERYEDLLGPEAIGTLQVTIDGPKAKHDSRRIYADGSGSFERICDNIDRALARQTRVDVRLNIDRTNLDELPAIATFFVERGWHGHPLFSAYTAPITATNGKTEKRTTFNSYDLGIEVRKLRERHADMTVIQPPDDSLRSQLRAILEGKSDPRGSMRTSFCGAHTAMYMFDPFGDIYACWERTGDKNIRIGWVDDEGEAHFVQDRLADWRSRTVTSNETCGQCRYSLYCGGGCAVLAEGLHGTMFGNYCDAFAKRMRTSLSEVYGSMSRGALPEDDERVLAMRSL